MFVITVAGKKYHWLNKNDDDFLQFLPEHFNCQPSDLAVEYISQADQVAFKQARQALTPAELAAGGDIVLDLTQSPPTIAKRLPPIRIVGDTDQFDEAARKFIVALLEQVRLAAIATPTNTPAQNVQAGLQALFTQLGITAVADLGPKISARIAARRTAGNDVSVARTFTAQDPETQPTITNIQAITTQVMTAWPYQGGVFTGKVVQ